MRSTSGICLTVVKSEAYQWYLDDIKVSLKYTNRSWMTIGKV